MIKGQLSNSITKIEEALETPLSGDTKQAGTGVFANESSSTVTVAHEALHQVHLLLEGSLLAFTKFLNKLEEEQVFTVLHFPRTVANSGVSRSVLDLHSHKFGCQRQDRGSHLGHFLRFLKQLLQRTLVEISPTW